MDFTRQDRERKMICRSDVQEVSMDWKEVDRLFCRYNTSIALRDRLENDLRGAEGELEALKADYRGHGYTMPSPCISEVAAGKHGVAMGDPTYWAMVSGEAALSAMAVLMERIHELTRQINKLNQEIRTVDGMVNILGEEDRALIRLRCFVLPPPSWTTIVGQWAALHAEDPAQACVSSDALRYRYQRICKVLADRF